VSDSENSQLVTANAQNDALCINTLGEVKFGLSQKAKTKA